jgi:hypothetical protein
MEEIRIVGSQICEGDLFASFGDLVRAPANANVIDGIAHVYRSGGGEITMPADMPLTVRRDVRIPMTKPNESINSTATSTSQGAAFYRHITDRMDELLPGGPDDAKYGEYTTDIPTEIDQPGMPGATLSLQPPEWDTVLHVIGHAGRWWAVPIGVVADAYVFIDRSRAEEYARSFVVRGTYFDFEPTDPQVRDHREAWDHHGDLIGLGTVLYDRVQTNYWVIGTLHRKPFVQQRPALDDARALLAARLDIG